MVDDNTCIIYIMILYPNLFERINDTLYFKDKSINEFPFSIVSKEQRNGLMYVNISNYQPMQYPRNMMLKLIFSPTKCPPSRYSPKGVLAMGKDYGLSDASCVKLYDLGINIEYGILNECRFISYDKDVIIRRHTLDNIINN